jgi:hypothetical protein
MHYDVALKYFPISFLNFSLPLHMKCNRSERISLFTFFREYLQAKDQRRNVHWNRKILAHRLSRHEIRK